MFQGRYRPVHNSHILILDTTEKSTGSTDEHPLGCPGWRITTQLSHHTHTSYVGYLHQKFNWKLQTVLAHCFVTSAIQLQNQHPKGMLSVSSGAATNFQRILRYISTSAFKATNFERISTFTATNLKIILQYMTTSTFFI